MPGTQRASFAASAFHSAQTKTSLRPSSPYAEGGPQGQVARFPYSKKSALSGGFQINTGEGLLCGLFPDGKSLRAGPRGFCLSEFTGTALSSNKNIAPVFKSLRAPSSWCASPTSKNPPFQADFKLIPNHGRFANRIPGGNYPNSAGNPPDKTGVLLWESTVKFFTRLK